MSSIDIKDIDIQVTQDGEKLWAKATHRPTKTVTFSHNYDASGQSKEEVIHDLLHRLGALLGQGGTIGPQRRGASSFSGKVL